MNELPRIEKFIYQTFATDSALNNLISARVYGYQIPRGAVFPLVHFSYLAGRDVQGTGKSRAQTRPLYQIKTIGRGDLNADLIAIADRIDEIVQNTAAVIIDGVTISARREQPLSYQEAGGESETSFRHLGGLYRFDTYF